MERAQVSLNWLEEERRARNWTQEYAAEQVQVDVCTYRRWEHGLHKPQHRQLHQLLRLFGKTPEEVQAQATPARVAEQALSARTKGKQTLPVVSSASDEPAEQDSYTQFQESDLTMRLFHLAWTWPLHHVGARYHALQPLVTQELEQRDNTMHENPVNRRLALRRLASIPIEMYSLSLVIPVMLRFPDDFLVRCGAGVTACWYLSRGKDLAFVADTVSRYIPTLEEVVKTSKGTQCKDAAELLVQCLVLKGVCVSHTHADHKASLRYTQEAEHYSELARNPVLTPIAIIEQAWVYHNIDHWERAVQAAEKARHLIETADEGISIPLYMQSNIYARLANYQAHCGQKQEAFRSLGQAWDTFYAAGSESLPLWLNYDEGGLLLNRGLTYYHLDMQQKAIQTFAKVTDLATTRETARSESFTDQVMAEVNRHDQPRDMDFCIDQCTQAIQKAIALHSEHRFSLAKIAYAAIQAAWPGEQRIKALRDLIVHW